MNARIDHCRLVVRLLQERDGQETTVLLSGSRTCCVFNVASGQDLGDDFDHITSNASPSMDGAPIDLFFTDEVETIIDPIKGEILWATTETASVR